MRSATVKCFSMNLHTLILQSYKISNKLAFRVEDYFKENRINALQVAKQITFQ